MAKPIQGGVLTKHLLVYDNFKIYDIFLVSQKGPKPKAKAKPKAKRLAFTTTTKPLHSYRVNFEVNNPKPFVCLGFPQTIPQSTQKTAYFW